MKLTLEDLTRILVKKETRILSKNLEFQYNNQLYQVRIDRPPYAMRHAPIVIVENWDGDIKVSYKNNELKFEVVTRLPSLEIADAKEIYQEVEKVVRRPWKPAANHPWRNYAF